MKESLPDWTTRIFRYLRRLTLDNDLAAELTQETMLKALQNQDKLKDPERDWNWLLRIATNVWNDWCRRKSKNTELQNSSIEAVDQRTSTLIGMIQQEELESLLLAVSELPERQKQVLSLYIW
ncbi:MAG: RNA polymerase sigma factor [Pirellulales bacterium]